MAYSKGLFVEMLSLDLNKRSRTILPCPEERYRSALFVRESTIRMSRTGHHEVDRTDEVGNRTHRTRVCRGHDGVAGKNFPAATRSRTRVVGTVPQDPFHGADKTSRQLVLKEFHPSELRLPCARRIHHAPRGSKPPREDVRMTPACAQETWDATGSPGGVFLESPAITSSTNRIDDANVLLLCGIIGRRYGMIHLGASSVQPIVRIVRYCGVLIPLKTGADHPPHILLPPRGSIS